MQLCEFFSQILKCDRIEHIGPSPYSKLENKTFGLGSRIWNIALWDEPNIECQSVHLFKMTTKNQKYFFITNLPLYER